MLNKYNHNLVPLGKKLRKEMTIQEKHLWYDFLAKYPLRFQRQKIIGNYIVDFYCAKAELVIELDGSQHYLEHGIQNDLKRTTELEKKNIRVIRFSNLDVENNFEGVAHSTFREISLPFTAKTNHIDSSNMVFLLNLCATT